MWWCGGGAPIRFLDKVIQEIFGKFTIKEDAVDVLQLMVAYLIGWNNINTSMEESGLGKEIVMLEEPKEELYFVGNHGILDQTKGFVFGI